MPAEAVDSLPQNLADGDGEERIRETISNERRTQFIACKQ